MALPPRVFYTMTEAAARWGCAPADIAGWASIGRLEIVTGIMPVRCDTETVAGLVAVAAADILPMFRRCGSGPERCQVRRIREPGAREWKYLSEPAEGIMVAMPDLVIMATEVQRFEEECDLLRRPHGGIGPSPKYDWDAFYLAVIIRLYERGVPPTQAEFVGEFQDWFSRRSESGDIPDESTIRRRLNPIWRALRAQA